MVLGQQTLAEEPLASDKSGITLTLPVADIIVVINTHNWSINAVILNTIVITTLFRTTFEQYVADTVAVIDTFTSSLGITLFAADVVKVVDTFRASISFRVAETVVVINNFRASIGIAFRDIISVVDNFTALLTKPLDFIAHVISSPKIKAGIKPFKLIGGIVDRRKKGGVIEQQ